MRTRFLFLCLLVATLLSCGARPQKLQAAKPSPHDPPRTLPIWVEDDPRMPKEDVLRGCQKWQVKNVTCVEVAEIEDSKVQVYSDDGVCVEKDAVTGAITRRILAWAFYGGRITMMAQCLSKTPEGKFNSHQLAAVVTHEVGHQLGIWDHVPDFCKEDEPLIHTETGRKICGTAVMNRHYNHAVSVVTVIDSMAFDERDPEFSLKIGHLEDVPICEYLSPAP